MKKRGWGWLGWIGLLFLVVSLGCLYNAIQDGLLAEDDSNSDPDSVIHHAEPQPTAESATHWLWGSCVSFAGAFVVGVRTFRARELQGSEE